MPKPEASIGIVCDSAAYLPPELRSNPNLEQVSFTISTVDGQRQWPDHQFGPNSAQEEEDFLADLTEHRLTTSQPNPEAYSTAFNRMIGRGVREIVVVPISTGLSSSMNSAQYAADKLSHQANIVVVDSKTASIGQSLLVAEALRTRDSSPNATDLAERVELLSRGLCVGQIFSDLSYLQKGGRIGQAQRYLGTILSVKPIIGINTEGEIKPISMARGWGGGCEAVVKYIAECVGENAVRLAFVHFESDKLEKLQEAASDKFNLARDESGHELEPLDCGQGMVIDVHSGTGVVGLGALIIKEGSRPRV